MTHESGLSNSNNYRGSFFQGLFGGNRRTGSAQPFDWDKKDSRPLTTTTNPQTVDGYQESGALAQAEVPNSPSESSPTFGYNAFNATEEELRTEARRQQQGGNRIQTTDEASDSEDAESTDEAENPDLGAEDEFSDEGEVEEDPGLSEDEEVDLGDEDLEDPGDDDIDLGDEIEDPGDGGGGGGGGLGGLQGILDQVMQVVQTVMSAANGFNNSNGSSSLNMSSLAGLGGMGGLDMMGPDAWGGLEMAGLGTDPFATGMGLDPLAELGLGDADLSMLNGLGLGSEMEGLV